jgi:hypothetical protein
MLRLALTFATLLLALGGCVTGGPRTVAPVAGRSGADIAGDEVGAVTAAVGEAAMPVAWSAPASREIAHPGAAALIGADRARLTDLLGEPRLRRREAPAEMWLYAVKACVLRIFLYRADAGAYRVAYIEASRRRAGADAEACLGQLIDERRAAHAS